MSAVTSNAFNASIVITELLAKTLENCAKDLSVRCITECARRHGFDASEEIRVLGLENLALIKKQMAKKSASKEPKAKKEKKEKVAKTEKKAKFPLPFIADLVNHSGCHGLSYNHGLFTQCAKTRMESGNFCTKCQEEADKNASGCPDAGTIQQRMSADFADSKSRKPVHYLKVLKKMNKTAEEAVDFAQQNKIVIPAYHLTAIEESTTRGRPKKATTVVTAAAVPDLFAALTQDVANETVPTPTPVTAPITAPVTAPVPTPVTATATAPVKKAKLSDEEKAAKKADKEKERNDKKQEKERADQEKKEKAAREKKEKEDKKEQERLAKEADKKKKADEKEAEKKKKEAEKKKKADEKEAAKKAKEDAKKAGKAVVTAEPAPAPEPVTKQEEEQKVGYTVPITIQGKEYYIDHQDNMLYDFKDYNENATPIGIYDKENDIIIPMPTDDDDDEEEVESDEESDDELDEESIDA
jgi:hypothetical protein